MEAFFFILALIVIGVVYLIDQNSESRLKEAAQRAWQRSDFQEYARLSQKLDERRRRRSSQSSSPGPVNFFAALFLLDFIDHGLFSDDHLGPGGSDPDCDCDDSDGGGWDDDYGCDDDNDYNDYF